MRHKKEEKKKRREKKKVHAYIVNQWLTNLQLLKSSNKNHASFFKD